MATTDLTELALQREWVERRLSSQYAVARVLAECEDVRMAARGILEAICTTIGWQIGSLYVVDPETQRLHCVQVWHDSRTLFPRFEQDTMDRVFARGEGLPGSVWTSAQSAWIRELEGDGNFVRQGSATAEGLHSALGFPIPGGEGVLGVIEFFSTEVREPDEDLLRMVSATGDQIGVFIERKLAEEALRRQNALLEAQNRAQQFLIQASAELDASLDFETTLANVAELALPYLADWCAIALLEDDRTIRRVATAHVDPEKADLLNEFKQRYAIDPSSRHPVAEVIRTGISQLNPEVPQERMETVAPDASHVDMVRQLGMVSSMIVPLRARGRNIGAISFMAGQSGRRFTRADLHLAEELARRAALAVDNARLFQQVQEALALRDEFLAAASHDLKGPLATIKGLAQLMVRFTKRDPIARDKILEGLSAIDASTNKMTSLINQLLDVSRVEMGHPLDLDLRTTDLVALVERVVKDERFAADRSRIVLKADEDSLVAESDPDRIERVVGNLVGNAVKYSSRDSQILVSVRRATPDESTVPAAAIEVSDQGVGIPAADLPHIFDQFHRAKNVRDRVRGSGIGLASARQIVTQHGGQILVDSQEGKGSRFTAVIPLEPPESNDQ